MSRFLLDTSCMIAAVCSWHEHHGAAAGEIEDRLGRGEELVSAAPALIETYAVLTRLPAPHRLDAVTAQTLVHANFIEGKVVVAPAADALCQLLRTAPERGIAGGLTYDAVIAACLVDAGSSVIVTFNERHFRALDLAGVTISVPGQVGH